MRHQAPLQPTPDDEAQAIETLTQVVAALPGILTQ
jgi:hypothetical protein